MQVCRSGCPRAGVPSPHLLHCRWHPESSGHLCSGGCLGVWEVAARVQGLRWVGEGHEMSPQERRGYQGPDSRAFQSRAQTLPSSRCRWGPGSSGRRWSIGSLVVFQCILLAGPHYVDLAGLELTKWSRVSCNQWNPCLPTLECWQWGHFNHDKYHRKLTLAIIVCQGSLNFGFDIVMSLLRTMSILNHRFLSSCRNGSVIIF